MVAAGHARHTATFDQLLPPPVIDRLLGHAEIRRNPRDLAAWVLEETPGWTRREIDAGIAKGLKLDIRVARKIPVAWIYLTGWVTRDGGMHFRDDIYGLDEKVSRPMVAEFGRPVATAARAHGVILQSADPEPDPTPVSYLDNR